LKGRFLIRRFRCDVAVTPHGGGGAVGAVVPFWCMAAATAVLPLGWTAMLLMDGFPRGLLSAPRVSASAAQVARGEGPQQTGEHLTGHWNLYGWTALTKKKTLPDPKDHGSQAHWVWNEGTPADIPSFEGTRVILLGPPSYERTWSSQRLFSRLPAELTVDRKLSGAEVDQWLDRMARARQT
jgi:hypothetical protein